jgi:pyruvate carboxylase
VKVGMEILRVLDEIKYIKNIIMGMEEDGKEGGVVEAEI